MRIAVAMSGGVDSSVAAALLSREGHEVTGLFMKTGVELPHGETASRRCCSLDDAWDAQRVADLLGIRFYALNYKQRFARILTDFAEEYQAGRTPNPCVRCNQWLKFGALLDEARSFGCEAVATGHYARLTPREGGGAGGAPRLLKALDPDKDQSYVLFALDPADLPAIRFPLGEMRKDEVRAVAREVGLPVKDKPESQDLCFAPAEGYRAVLDAHRKRPAEPGDFVDLDGNVLGTHPGVEHFTVGQRKGLGIALGHPVYVVRIEPASRRVVLGADAALWSDTLEAAEASWLSGKAPEAHFRAQVQIRYQHEPASAEVEPLSGGRFRARFDHPQRAITPGQAAVVYAGDEVLGGGWIR